VRFNIPDKLNITINGREIFHAWSHYTGNAKSFYKFYFVTMKKLNSTVVCSVRE